MEPPEFEQLVDAHYGDLYRFAVSLTRNPDEACDLTQQVFVTFARKGDKIRDRTKCRSWLFTSLYRDFLRQNKRAQRLTSMDEEGLELCAGFHPPEADPTIAHHEAREALLSLDEAHRAILSLFYLDDCSYKEIAVRLNVPIGTVMSRISRAKAALRARLQDRPADPQTDEPPEGINPRR